ncbi:hypothetical protein C8P64_0782 [Christiangramia gaetbulicola]|uniref:Uncharacterized protein n=1 Tax=Christiangramia gaetbulicola TaxID=703340 RepID=A0A2T6ALW9_9FLAO|nr:hypothetical protein C8P64_0782 [Christiangramia gaetbulicola]
MKIGFRELVYLKTNLLLFSKTLFSEKVTFISELRSGRKNAFSSKKYYRK